MRTKIIRSRAQFVDEYKGVVDNDVDSICVVSNTSSSNYYYYYNKINITTNARVRV